MRRKGLVVAARIGTPSLLILLLAARTLAQTGTRVTFGINPTIFRSGQPATAELSVFSVSSTPVTLSAGTTFNFFVDPSFGTVQSSISPVAVESASLLPADFSVTFAGGQRPVTVTYNGMAKTFAFGDCFSVKVTLLASSQAGPGKLSLSSQLITTINGALPFTTASIVDFANGGTSAITHDQTLIGDGTSAMPLGVAPGAALVAVVHGPGLAGSGTTISPLDAGPAGIGSTRLASGAVTLPKIAPGQVVASLNGLKDDVTLAAAGGVTITPDGNTLRITGVPVASQALTARSGEIGGLEDSGRIVVSTLVPAGSYEIKATIDLLSKDNDDQTATCTLSTGDSAKVRIPGSGGGEFWQRSLTLLDTATFTDQTTITVTCQGFAVLAERSVITATRVGSVQ